jgi:hypothetical protein
MRFSDTIKQKVKERAHLRCCVCHKRFATCVHHIVPEASAGPSTEDNAAPLCPACHFEYGNNPDMRSFIKQSRDVWYKLCDARSAPDHEMIREIHEHVSRQVVTKEDLRQLKVYLNDRIESILGQPLPVSKQAQMIADTTAIFSDLVASSSDVVATDRPFVFCSECGSEYDADATQCPDCDWPNAFL